MKKAIAAAILMTLSMAAMSQDQRYVLTDLGELPGSLQIIPRDIDESGNVVGLIKYSRAQNAFLWDGRLQDLGSLPGLAFGTMNAINDFGRGVGTAGTGRNTRAFAWENDVFTEINVGSPTTEGIDNNNRGSIVFNYVDFFQQTRAALFFNGALTIAIEPLDDLSVVSQATTMNAVNIVGGREFLPDGTVQAWTMDPGEDGAQNTAQQLAVRQAGDDWATVNDIGAGRPFQAGGDSALRVRDYAGGTHYVSTGWFRDTEGTVYIAQPLTGNNVTSVNGVAPNRVRVVGRSGIYVNLNNRVSFSWRGCLFIPFVDLILGPILIPVDVNTLIPQNSGIVIDNLLGVNDAGQVVGTYTQNGRVRAVVLTPAITPVNITVTDPVTLGPTSTIYGGETATGGVSISQIADQAPVPVNLRTTNGIVSVPATVSIPRNQSQAAFPIQTSPVTTVVSVNIIAERQGYSFTRTIQVAPPTLSTLILNPNPVTGGLTSNGTVNIRGRAPFGGLRVQLSSSDTSVARLNILSLLIPAGGNTASFQALSNVLPTNRASTIRASLFGVTRQTVLNVVLPFLQSFTLSADTAVGGAPVTGTLRLSNRALTNQTILLTSSSPSAAGVPASVSIPAGGSGTSFPITTVPRRAVATVTLSARLGTVTLTRQLTIREPRIVSVTLNPATVLGSASSVATVTLDGRAPTGGLTIAMNTSDASAAQVAQTLTVPSNALSAPITVRTSVVASDRTVQVVATLNTLSRSGNLNIQGATLTGIRLISFTDVDGDGGLSVGDNARFRVTLNRPAQAPGAVVQLASDNATVMQTPFGGVLVPTGNTQLEFNVAALAAGDVRLTANRGGVSFTTPVITVLP